MKRLKPEKLHVSYSDGISQDSPVIPRRYTLTHSDFTGDLYLVIGLDYDRKRISHWYTKLMRDEVLAEFASEEEGFVLRVYCHVSGGFVLGKAKWRYDIFQSELPLVLEAIRYGDRTLFEQNPGLDNTPVIVHFKSTNRSLDKVKNWGTMADYR